MNTAEQDTLMQNFRAIASLGNADKNVGGGSPPIAVLQALSWSNSPGHLNR
ncbi:hypothetical protein C4J96_2114 [Pseudomonas orientalis]|nr:hypothetical protein C4J96_2114 [Pseudomonas orientalis]